MPIEPPATDWAVPDPMSADGDVVALGADLDPGTVLAAYRRGLFPMHLDGMLAWWSPVERGVVPLDGVRVSRSLRRSVARYDITVDTAFAEVVDACADPARPGAWINAEIRAAYARLHELGWAHSVEARSRDDGALAGGLYGLAVGGLFAGESMFHHRTDASKAALLGLVDLLGGAAGAAQGRLLDVQWVTPHLASLGAVALDRAEYLRRLEHALTLPLAPGCAGIPSS